jgi:hypothetical protein
METKTRDVWTEALEKVIGLKREQIVNRTPYEIYQALCKSPVWAEREKENADQREMI